MHNISHQKDIELLFLKSALTIENPFNTTEEILQWVKKRNKDISVNIKRIGFDEMDNWSLDKIEAVFVSASIV